MAVTTYIVDKNGKQIDAADLTGNPSDRHFREVRQPLLDAEDVAYMKALEADDASAKTASVAKKKALRDAPAASAIDSADTIAKLKAAWDTSVLGASPYA